MRDFVKQGSGSKAAAKIKPTIKPKSHKFPSRARQGFKSASTQNLAVRFLDSSGKIVVGGVVEYFGMSKSQLAQTVGLSREALYKQGRRTAPKTQSRMREMLEIVSRVRDWAGGKDQAMAWYRSEPLPAFGNRTAESLVKSDQAGLLRDYLDHLATGGYA